MRTFCKYFIFIRCCYLKKIKYCVLVQLYFVHLLDSVYCSIQHSGRRLTLAAMGCWTDSTECFSFQPVLHNWCNRSRDMKDSP